MLKTLYLIIWLAAMSYADIKRRKINIISIVVMSWYYYAAFSRRY